MTPRGSRRRQTEELATDHLSSVAREGGELGHLLAEDAHFLAVRLVGSEGENLFSDR